MASRPDELRIVLVGKTGGGKTLIRNFLLETPESSHLSTKECDIKRGECGGQKLAVIDTPGVYNIEMTKDKVLKEIAKCMIHAQPGPHVFLYVVGPMSFTQEDYDAMEIIQNIFGPKSKDHTLVVVRSNKAPGGLSKIESEFRGGYHLLDVNNKSSNPRSELLEKIMKLVQENKGEHYTNKAFEEAQKAVEKEKEKRKTDMGSDDDMMCDLIEAMLKVFMVEEYAGLIKAACEFWVPRKK